VQSKTGNSARVAKQFAPAFQNLVDYLDGIGYKITSLGGYNNRSATGDPSKKSIHAYGGAIDINPGSNPYGTRLVTDMPREIAAVAAQYGLGWGGSWKNIKDAMHFSAANSEGGNLLAADKGADLGVGDVAVVGERGPELVSGPGQVTSRAQTNQVFTEIAKTLKEIKATLADSNNVHKRTLSAVA
jgi:hypothetical protein